MRRALPLLLVALLVVASCSGSSSSGLPTTTSAPADAGTTMGTTTSVAPTTTVPTPVVAGLGDSQLFEAAEELRTALPGIDVQTEAVIGLTVDEGHFGLQRLLTTDPAALAVVLGTNNVTDGDVTSEELTELDALAREAAEVPCLHWVDLPTTTPSIAFNEAAETFNQALVQTSIRHGFLLVRWSFEFAAHPEWLRPDGLHYTEEAQAALAGSIASAIRTCLAARGRS